MSFWFYVTWTVNDSLSFKDNEQSTSNEFIYFSTHKNQ